MQIDTTALSTEELTKLVNDANVQRAQILPGNEDPALREQFSKTLLTIIRVWLDVQNIPPALPLLRELMQYRDESAQTSVSIAWIIFSLLKLITSDELYRKHYLDAVPGFLDYYRQLSVSVPSPVHSAICLYANKAAGDHSLWFIDFMKRAGFESLQDSDFQENSKDGRRFNPLAEQLFIKAAKIIEHTNNCEGASWLTENIPLIKKRVPSEQWIIYHQGKLLLMLNRAADARLCLKEILTRQKNQFWIWAAYGATFQEENKDLYLAALCKALSFPVDEHLQLEIRDELAQLLIANEMYDEAKTEIETILRVKQNYEYRLSPRLQSACSESWYGAARSMPNNIALYLKHIKTADSLLAEERTWRIGVVTAPYEDNRGVFIQFDTDKVTLYRLPKQENKQSLPAIGTVLCVSIEEVMISGQKRYSAVSLAPTTEMPPQTFYKLFSGQLKATVKADNPSFGFVDDVFVSAELLRQSPGAKEVRGSAVFEFNKKRNQYGWKALTLQAAPPNPPAEVPPIVQDPPPNDKVEPKQE